MDMKYKHTVSICEMKQGQKKKKLERNSEEQGLRIMKQLGKVITSESARLGSRPFLLGLTAAQRKHDIDLSVGIQEVEGELVQGGLRETGQE